jgi:hypothetical protein
MPDRDLVERCIQLYDKYWRFRKRGDKEKFKNHLRKSETPIELITHELTEAEEYALNRVMGSFAGLHKASNILYRQHSEMFAGKTVLEIGSRRHIDRKLVELAKSYHAIDPYYHIINCDPFIWIDRVLSWPVSMLQKITDKGLRDDFAYDMDSLIESLTYTENSDIGLREYRNESGNIRLMAGKHNQVPMTYEVVINGGARIDEEEVPEVKALLAKGGILIFMGFPDICMRKEDGLITEFFRFQREIWVELVGKKIGGIYTAFIGSDSP